MKVSELTGPALDWAVAKCEGHVKGCDEKGEVSDWSPSTKWHQGGPIIDREKIKVAPNLGGTWLGQIRHEKSHKLVANPVLAGWTNKHGPTPLIAAMRCYVAAKLGETVDVPAEF